jgi:hypothetical protein
MKLTKGKISKLYNKNKQTLKKKANKRKTSNKSKTFRRKQKINLARKTLKRFHYKKQKGGEIIPPKEVTTKDDADVDIVSSENVATPIEKSVVQPVEQPLENPVVSETEPVEKPVVSEAKPVEKPVESEAEPVVQPVVSEAEPVVQPVVSEAEPVVSEAEHLVDEEPPIVEKPLVSEAEPVVEPMEEHLVSEAEPVVEKPMEEPVLNDESPLAGTDTVKVEDIQNTPTFDLDTEETPSTTTEPTSSLPMSEQKTEQLKAAIDTVIDYISNKVSENVSNKVTQNISSSSGENIQNGFDSINKTVETMASNGVTTGGGNWVNSKDDVVVEDAMCPICHENFAETPNQAIYKSVCGHVFHNDCMLQVCQLPLDKRICPMCRKPLEDDCSDVYAFKNKALVDPDNEEAPYFEDIEIQNIYENQR